MAGARKENMLWRRKLWLFAMAACLHWVAPCVLRADVLGSLRGVVHDPQHRPIAGARVTLRAADSGLVVTAESDQDGEFSFFAVALGIYTITADKNGFDPVRLVVTVSSGMSPALHLQLPVARVNESVTVTEQTSAANVASATPTTLIGRRDIARTPGADRTNSLAMITDYVPGAYMTHDMLHMRGGHQLSWLIDGVDIPNTNIASNIAPQIDPKDIDYVGAQRGSYEADLGDRTYGVFNVAPRTGFERNREGELVTSFGNFYQSNDQLSLGNHSEKAAWYLSLNGNRSGFGLEPAIENPIHDAENGYGGFGSWIDNWSPANQLRLVGQLRSDYYQIPYDPNPEDWQNQLYNSSGLRDGEHETDGYLAATWVHTLTPTRAASEPLLQFSPFFHYNRADYAPGANDLPNASTAVQRGDYEGVQGSIGAVIARNTLKAGVYGYGQQEGDLFGATFPNDSAQNFSQPENVAGGVEELYIEDNYRPVRWLTLIGGERQSHFAGAIAENAVYPRIGAALQLPWLHWVLRGFYGRFYQPPPLTTVSGPLLAYAHGAQTSFVPLHGERDEEHQFGLQIPFRGWLLDADTFETRARNFLDHSNIGESSIFIPVTIAGARIQAWELTLRSPSLWRYGQLHLAYSNQLAQQIGAITGGLICQSPNPQNCAVPPGYSPLDHDQRDTLNVGLNGNLPHQTYASFNFYYGSGFANGYTAPPSPYRGAYLPGHPSAAISAGKTVGKNFTLALNADNVSNTRVLLDNSLTFGGFHYNEPRQIYGEMRYRFHF